jgi:hypothetical protein
MVLSCVVDHILQEFNTVSDQTQNLQNCYTTPYKIDQERRHLGTGVTSSMGEGSKAQPVTQRKAEKERQRDERWEGGRGWARSRII